LGKKPQEINLNKSFRKKQPEGNLLGSVFYYFVAPGTFRERGGWMNAAGGVGTPCRPSSEPRRASPASTLHLSVGIHPCVDWELLSSLRHVCLPTSPEGETRVSANSAKSTLNFIDANSRPWRRLSLSTRLLLSGRELFPRKFCLARISFFSVPGSAILAQRLPVASFCAEAFARTSLFSRLPARRQPSSAPPHCRKKSKRGSVDGVLFVRIAWAKFCLSTVFFVSAGNHARRNMVPSHPGGRLPGARTLNTTQRSRAPWPFSLETALAVIRPPKSLPCAFTFRNDVRPAGAGVGRQKPGRSIFFSRTTDGPFRVLQFPPLGAAKRESGFRRGIPKSAGAFVFSSGCALYARPLGVGNTRVRIIHNGRGSVVLHLFCRGSRLSSPLRRWEPQAIGVPQIGSVFHAVAVDGCDPRSGAAPFQPAFFSAGLPGSTPPPPPLVKSRTP